MVSESTFPLPWNSYGPRIPFWPLERWIYLNVILKPNWIDVNTKLEWFVHSLSNKDLDKLFFTNTSIYAPYLFILSFYFFSMECSFITIFFSNECKAQSLRVESVTKITVWVGRSYVIFNSSFHCSSVDFFRLLATFWQFNGSSLPVLTYLSFNQLLILTDKDKQQESNIAAALQDSINTILNVDRQDTIYTFLRKRC